MVFSLFTGGFTKKDESFGPTNLVELNVFDSLTKLANVSHSYTDSVAVFAARFIVRQETLQSLAYTIFCPHQRKNVRVRTKRHTVLVMFVI